jgi:hypothetical protein
MVRDWAVLNAHHGNTLTGQHLSTRRHLIVTRSGRKSGLCLGVLPNWNIDIRTADSGDRNHASRCSSSLFHAMLIAHLGGAHDSLDSPLL